MQQPYGMPYGQPYGMPYGQPMQFGPVPFGQFFGPYRSGDVVAEDSEESIIKQLMYPPPPMFYPQPPPRMPQRIPSVVDVNPSPFVCSCDADCKEYQDCCADVDAECVW